MLFGDLGEERATHLRRSGVVPGWTTNDPVQTSSSSEIVAVLYPRLVFRYTPAPR